MIIGGLEVGLTVERDNLPALVRALEQLSAARVLVGVPATEALRRPVPGEKRPPNNAMLAYVHENGAPTRHIPPRPFLRPGIQENRRAIAQQLERAGRQALAGQVEAMERQLHIAGAIARDFVRLKITTGPFVPLAARTIAARRRRSAGSRYRRRATTAADVTPLIDTGQLRNAINYVIRRVAAQRLAR